MNIAERAEDLDYEPDVLKFKQIWDSMNETKKDKASAPSALPPAGSSKSKKKIQPKAAEQPKPSKKQTVISDKNVTRNPKADHQTVIEVVTKPSANYEDSLNHKKFMGRNDFTNDPTLQGDISSLKKVVDEKDYELSLLRVSNTRYEDRIRQLEAEIVKRDDRISELQGRERQLLSHNNILTGNEKIFDYGQVEYENFRNDTRRLLKMLQTTEEYQQFANLALDDNGVRFLHAANKKSKSALDNKEKTRLHFCTCNKEFIPESGFWVPENVYTFAKEFVKERKGDLTQAELELLLYDLNKMWREREKRIINTLNSQKGKEVDKLKRKIALQKSASTRE